MKVRRDRRPRIFAASLPLLEDINAYIERYDLRGEAMAHAASDVLDGGCTRFELEDLLTRRLLCVVPLTYHHQGGWDAAFDDELCGKSYTVALTPKAMRRLWPARINAQP